MTVQHRKDGKGIGPSHAGRPSREGGMHMQAGVVYSNPNARIHGDQLLGLCIMICSGLHSVLHTLWRTTVTHDIKLPPVLAQRCI